MKKLQKSDDPLALIHALDPNIDGWIAYLSERNQQSVADTVNRIIDSTFERLSDPLGVATVLAQLNPQMVIQSAAVDELDADAANRLLDYAKVSKKAREAIHGAVLFSSLSTNQFVAMLISMRCDKIAERHYRAEQDHIDSEVRKIVGE